MNFFISYKIDGVGTESLRMSGDSCFSTSKKRV